MLDTSKNFDGEHKYNALPEKNEELKKHALEKYMAPLSKIGGSIKKKIQNILFSKKMDQEEISLEEFDAKEKIASPELAAKLEKSFALPSTTDSPTYSIASGTVATLDPEMVEEDLYEKVEKKIQEEGLEKIQHDLNSPRLIYPKLYSVLDQETESVDDIKSLLNAAAEAINEPNYKIIDADDKHTKNYYDKEIIKDIEAIEKAIKLNEFFPSAMTLSSSIYKKLQNIIPSLEDKIISLNDALRQSMELKDFLKRSIVYGKITPYVNTIPVEDRMTYEQAEEFLKNNMQVTYLGKGEEEEEEETEDEG